jgi:hypothetical protein
MSPPPGTPKVNRTSTDATPFLYDGRDGVMTDTNGLYYMRSSSH